MDLMCMGQTTL